MSKSDLEGFTLFCERKGSSFDLSVAMIMSASCARLTYGAMKCLGNAEYVNVFFDEPGKRMMLRKAEKDNANVFKMSAGHNLVSQAVRKQILAITGSGAAPTWSGYRYEGYQPVPDSVIFDLKKYSVLNFVKRKKETE